MQARYRVVGLSASTASQALVLTEHVFYGKLLRACKAGRAARAGTDLGVQRAVCAC